MLDSGLKLEDGTILSKADFEELLDLDNNELRVAFKITEKHLNVVGKERMKVVLAFQLFSSTVARAFKKYFPEKEKISKFIQLVNDASDVLNSRIPDDSKNKLKSAYGKGLAEQERILEEFARAVRNLRVGKAQTLYPFQKGILITITSLRGIYQELCGPPFYLKYLMTSRFNQDHVENIFCIVRMLGGFYSHPAPVECINRLKCYMLSTNLKPKSSSNTGGQEDNSQILSTLMELSKDRSQEASRDEIISAYWDESVNIDIPDDQTHPILTDENWDEFIASLSSSEQCEFGGQEYIAGFIAKKFKEKYKNLQSTPNPQTSASADSWVNTVSRGSLTVPSLDWLSLFLRFNSIFIQYHKSDTDNLDINRSCGVMSHLEDIISKSYRDVPKEIIKYFVRTRTFIRIRSINANITANTFAKRRFF